MDPNAVAQRLSLLGVAGYAFFFFLRPNPEGLALALGLALGGAALAYRERPFPVPFFLGLFLLLLAFQLWRGEPLAFLLGGGLGLGLPYLAWRLRKPAR
ncbi:MAG: hypothetical protein C4300_08615 [Thermus sp.]|uniref:hypothetical protein n=1 Tax=Thermus sp. TaxID=275 RepID=UPI0033193DEA